MREGDHHFNRKKSSLREVYIGTRGSRHLESPYLIRCSFRLVELSELLIPCTSATSSWVACIIWAFLWSLGSSGRKENLASVPCFSQSWSKLNRARSLTPVDVPKNYKRYGLKQQHDKAGESHLIKLFQTRKLNNKFDPSRWLGPFKLALKGMLSLNKTAIFKANLVGWDRHSRCIWMVKCPRWSPYTVRAANTGTPHTANRIQTKAGMLEV